MRAIGWERLESEVRPNFCEDKMQTFSPSNSDGLTEENEKCLYPPKTQDIRGNNGRLSQGEAFVLH